MTAIDKTRIVYNIPMKLPSLANLAGSWKANYYSNKKKKELIRLVLTQNEYRLPCHVIITRVSPRMLDSIDNLPASVKFVIDAVADYLIPGLRPGRADGDKRLSFEVKQEKGCPREQALILELIF